MSLTFIGDIHGWHDRLEDILGQVEGPLLFVGDLVDRGPDSRAVVTAVKALCDAGRARCLLGNHEFALVRGMGVPERSIAPFPSLLRAWWERYGGQATVRSYGLERFDPEAFRAALGDHLVWLADLPWFLEGEEEGRPWFAVHGGLAGDESLEAQRRSMGATRWWSRARSVLPPQLYSKHLRFTRPAGLGEGVCVVSGHTPLVQPYLEPDRILCDTTGGKAGTALCAVVFPAMRLLRSRGDAAADADGTD